MIFSPAFKFSLALLLTTATALPAALEPSPNNGDIELPDGFAAVVVADGVESPRFLAVAPNGDVYAKLRRGGITALRDTDGDGMIRGHR
jgi:glucose/arabinose dehydrogenase